MSHVVVLQTKINDPVAVAAACQRLNLSRGLSTAWNVFNCGLLAWNGKWPAANRE